MDFGLDAVICAQPLLGSMESAFQYIQNFTGFFTPGILVIFLVALFWKKATTLSVLVAAIMSLILSLGLRFLVMAFLSVMLGGVGTFEGPVLGSALIGALVPGFQWLREVPIIVDILSPIFSEVLVFITAIIIVKFRPQGLIKRGRL